MIQKLRSLQILAALGATFWFIYGAWHLPFLALLLLWSGPVLADYRKDGKLPLSHKVIASAVIIALCIAPFIASLPPILSFRNATLLYPGIIMNDDSSFLLFIAVLLLIYFLPALIAFVRRHPNRWPILLVNVAFGATIIGWFGSLIWANRALHLSRHRHGSSGGESGLNIFSDDIKAVRLIDRREPSLSSPHASSPADFVQSLERLKELHASGHIDNVEYDALKRAVLKKV